MSCFGATKIYLIPTLWVTVYIEYGEYEREMKWRGGSAKRARGCLNGEDHQLIDGSVRSEVGGSSSLRRRERRRGDGWYSQSSYKETEQTEADRRGGSSLFAPSFLVESGEEQRWRNGPVEVNIPLWRQTVSLAGRQCSNPHGLLTPPRWQPAARLSWHAQTHSERESAGKLPLWKECIRGGDTSTAVIGKEKVAAGLRNWE